MAFSRARFLSLLFTVVHGAWSVSVRRNICLLGLGVGVPLVQGLEVDRRELPLPHRVDLADDEPGALLGLGDREPELGQVDAALDQHPLEQRHLLHELLVLLVGAEAHHPLDAGAVVPGAVEQHDLAGGRQVLT